MESQPAAKRRLRQREEARRAILEGTESLLVEDGYEGFSMRRLAERCGYTAPTVYYYFGDKQGLLDALLEERMAGLLQRLRRVPASEDPLERIRHLFLAFVRFGIKNPTHYRLLMTPRGDRGERPPSAEKCEAIFLEPMHELAEAGRLRVADDEAARQVALVTLHGLISLRGAGSPSEMAKNLNEIAVDVMLAGLIAPEATTAPGARA
ncbi:MAG: TetR/AcrR family transcriptional regulator [Deltaproteobacteria bacterium]|nr:TetR/AcrR family transcriptional regulator [Deltaproteobacteria bacterium]MBW2413783.1 TetR/AcrR family transcriptional regulator [Deltaproteobacteria bacterium]